MSLRFPYKTGYTPTDEEVKANLAFSLLEDQADVLCASADLLAQLGKSELTTDKYRSILHGQMIIIYISNIKKYMVREGLFPTSCNILDVDTRYRVSCVIEGLSCKSNGINLRKLFDDVLAIYELTTIPCTFKGEFKDNGFNKPGFVD
jgi:hypothetical protein